jgi:sortase (surface protein transpeptidase)
VTWRGRGQLALLAGFALVLLTVPAGSPAVSRPAVAAVRTPSVPPESASFRSARTFDQVADPVRLRIPAIHVDTPLDRLGRQPDGTIAVPDRFEVAGWYDEGPRPGEAGPAVILGHVDSRSGPAVFFRLSTLPVGAAVEVDRADATTATFRVTSVAHVPKTGFPTNLVYSPTLQPALRLVTCGGSFDQRARSYRDNVIVYAAP